ncbi:hypothetical protein TNCV_3267271 [Trichonephila clavipes]|nr:hypothetical protein TNCV_3267271 [Trichonephila clavipes]
MDVCKCIVPLRHGGTQNSRRVASPLVWLVEGVERWEAPDHPQVSSLKIDVETSQIVLSPLNDVLIPSCSRLYYPSGHVIRGPVFHKIIPGPISLAYLWTALGPLILFFDQQDHQTFYQSNMSGHGRVSESGTPKYRRSGATTG